MTVVSVNFQQAGNAALEREVQHTKQEIFPPRARMTGLKIMGSCSPGPLDLPLETGLRPLDRALGIRRLPFSARNLALKQKMREKAWHKGLCLREVQRC